MFIKHGIRLSVLSVPVLVAVFAAAAPLDETPTDVAPAALLEKATGQTIRVPADASTIQGALDKAAHGDMVLVSPGVYRETLVLKDKAVTLASEFIVSGDKGRILDTVLDGAAPGTEEGRMDYVILVGEDAPPDTQIVGFTIQNGDDGISCEANVRIVHNRFVNNVDAIDYEGGGGLCSRNTFERNKDDAIDLDGPCEGVFEHNLIRDNEDDGIEIRLHPYSGPLRTAVIRYNRIEGSGEDGIQFIDYPEPSNRSFRIERNVIANSAMAGIAFMGGTNTRENYEAADVDEYVLLLNNTLSGNEYGICGGNCVIALNDIIVNTKREALRRVDYNSVVSHVILWNNGRDNAGSNLVPGAVLTADPLLDDDGVPMRGSPCIDAGTNEFVGEDAAPVRLAPSSYHGAAPDMGAAERLDTP